MARGDKWALDTDVLITHKDLIELLTKGECSLIDGGADLGYKIKVVGEC